MRSPDPWWVWLLPVGFAAPWITAIIGFWRTRSRDDELPPSMADEARKRLWES
ncbi:MAG: hypothetical protein QOK36_2003 [Gaiellales bacterium]|jgi:hypothetical protein|nr:hypothetical protein [Gaiellales bacterium]